MNRYDWDRGYRSRRNPGGGYGWEYGGRAGRPLGWGRGGYDRGAYGRFYPGYGGYPGDREEGMYYGEPRRSPGWEPRQGRGWGGGGYDREFAREPFLPEAAYQRHPEFDRPPSRGRDRWPDEGGSFDYGGHDDGEVVQAVRQSLYQDNYIDADGIDVEVNGGVVTLTGEVNDFMEARYAWDDAWETPGVRGVVNQLTVRTDQPAGEHEVIPQTTKGKKK